MAQEVAGILAAEVLSLPFREAKIRLSKAIASKGVDRISRKSLYKYQPLPDQEHIRLLWLSKDDNGELCFELDAVNLGNAPLYEAVSYTWGIPSRTAFVSHRYSGRRLNITQNCYDVLQNLCERAPRVLWIDAMCINQDDLNERGQQVAIMARIFQGALRTIAYVGPSDDDFTHVQRACAEFGNGTGVFGPLMRHVLHQVQDHGARSREYLSLLRTDDDIQAHVGCSLFLGEDYRLIARGILARRTLYWQLARLQYRGPLVQLARKVEHCLRFLVIETNAIYTTAYTFWGRSVRYDDRSMRIAALKVENATKALKDCLWALDEEALMLRHIRTCLVLPDKGLVFAAPKYTAVDGGAAVEIETSALPDYRSAIEHSEVGTRTTVVSYSERRPTPTAPTHSRDTAVALLSSAALDGGQNHVRVARLTSCVLHLSGVWKDRLEVPFGGLTSYESAEKAALHRINTTCDQWRMVFVAMSALGAAFGTLFNRPWFSRTWILQEVLLSPRVVVQAGRDSFPFADLRLIIAIDPRLASDMLSNPGNVVLSDYLPSLGLPKLFKIVAEQ
ncbi:Heterokaryon incompatibility protein 6, OR allele [Fulvia fulva]|uniref:Heterokaryon incompatibility protein 6, OR allele n=1 Tax=Passalora fulva TaxID=5499 RepID=A0A9Q8P3U0_PASFU|nr:Heterokaryon incompatibility protein 6, OR allele [Fulvia fulva]KAK4634092.1 Heterokaryon incompatibility protein 6, OR allele [Fulvia fulva]KAK4637578.1 Heterokaryon incompatibility protein 6, OR allele [Fulvia fulva]UJO12375.1 Heterokaryon incompatibility protein 6, OR allele [Fulvia fulva]WPV09672.1 Heterokaryon incompatibility protein 6, OR allele [Fulvia fulva]WPV23741.1 Heterokaryon incompatibility protein 6, OR allele [Fulvia fulva]